MQIECNLDEFQMQFWWNLDAFQMQFRCKLNALVWHCFGSKFILLRVGGWVGGEMEFKATSAKFSLGLSWGWAWQLPIFWHILDVFSAQDDPIELKPFPLNQASWDTRLEYQQGVLRSTLKFQYFWLWPLLRGP